MEPGSLHILCLEDEPLDAELIEAHLKRQGVVGEIARVDTREAFVHALSHPCDVIIADYSLPTFNGLEALELARQLVPEVPFIFFSGQIGEERAIETLKRGATDYVLKHQMSRLAPAVQRAVREAAERSQWRLTEAARAGLEEQLRHAQKLEAVGQLTGGVAHDFNNLLQVIIGCADMGLLRLSPEHPARADLEQIESAARRAVELTHKLLAFSRRSVLRREAIQLNTLLPELARMLHRLLPAQIEFELDLGSDLPPLQGDASMLETAILNLVINARDAMPEGGRITCRTRLVEGADAPLPPAADGAALPCLRLEISDTGPGIATELREQVFEPFFTTKDEGKGTGLGLASVQLIVDQHAGLVRVESSSAAGTTFAIYLPALVEPPACLLPLKPEETLHGTECLLLAEDDPVVCELERRILQTAGYEVLLAGDGEEALKLFAQHADQIGGVLLDLSMPRLGGAEAARRLRALRPSLPVLFVSADGSAGHDCAVPGAGYGLLIKPYTMEELLRAVRDCLRGPHQG